MTELSARSNIPLTADEQGLIRSAHPDYEKVLLEKEFGGGFSKTRVFLVLPVRANGVSDARVVTKIGSASDLQREKENYDNLAGPGLPFLAAQVKGYYPQGDQAALNYAFAGGGALGETLTLEDYYHAQPAEIINKTLNVLLDQTLGAAWYGQNQPLNCLFRDEYGRHLRPREELAKIVSVIYPRLESLDRKHIQIPGLIGAYPDPLVVYPDLLDRTLKGRRSFVHGDLHIRNILVDESGKGWLIDFAKVKERHNLFDFIKLETYIRLMALPDVFGAFSLNEYVQFEQTLNATTLGQASTPPTNPELAKTYQVIQTIREIAHKYMGYEPSFKNEYFPALFLYSLSMLKYFPINGPIPTQLMFVTSCVLGKFILRLDEHPAKSDGMSLSNDEHSAKSGEIVSNDIEAHVDIYLMGEYRIFTSTDKTGFHYALSRLLNIRPEQISILLVRPGSIIITLKMPEESAKKLMKMWLVDNDLALRALNIRQVDLLTEIKSDEASKMAKTKNTSQGGISIGGNANGSIIVTGNQNKINQINRKINTGGGTYIQGDVNTGGGDFVGRDKIDRSIKVGDISNSTGVAIGDNAQANVAQSSGASVDEIARAFAIIMAEVNRERDGAKKEKAEKLVRKMEAEARKGEQADAENVEGWFSVLANTSADAWDVAVATLSSPIEGIGMVFKKIVQRLREEKGKN